eukprot:m.28454 g.28454  ORF g.28454 m.28454 type:complete len:522 (+) comp30794_c0_seq5:206-1771(+)
MTDFTRMSDDEFAKDSQLNQEQIQRRHALLAMIKAGKIGGEEDEDGVFGNKKGGVSRIFSLKEKIRQTSKITGTALKSKIKDMRKKKKETEGAKEAGAQLPVFGVPINLAVERSRLCHGIELPTVFRKCIDFIEENGLDYEGIYRVSGVKSRIEGLKASFDKGKSLDADQTDINVVAGVLKLYLRELPESILTSALLPEFEQASREKSLDKIAALVKLLPIASRTMLSWLLMHFQHIIDFSSANRMSAPNLVLVFSPTLHISQNLLNTLIINADRFTGRESIEKYDEGVATMKKKEVFRRLSAVDSMEPEMFVLEIPRLEGVISRLHSELQSTQLTDRETADKEDQIWEVQRLLTHMKRKQRVQNASTFVETVASEATEDEDQEESIQELEYEREKYTFTLEEYSHYEQTLRAEIEAERNLIESLKEDLSHFETSKGSRTVHPEAGYEDLSETDPFSVSQLKDELQRLAVCSSFAEVLSHFCLSSQDIRDQHVADINLEREACTELRAEIKLLTGAAKAVK